MTRENKGVYCTAQQQQVVAWMGRVGLRVFSVALLNADLPVEGMAQAGESRLFRLSPSERVEFGQKLANYDALVADLNLINVDSFRFLTEFQGQLAERVSAGAILICFTSRPNLHSPDGLQNKYSWLPGFDGSSEIREDLVDKVSVAKDTNGITQAFENHIRGFYATCSFPKGFGADPYQIVLRGDDGTPVGLQKQLGTGVVVLVPQCEEKRSVIESVLGWWAGQREGAGSSETSPSPVPGGGDLAEFETLSGEYGSGEVQELFDLVPESARTEFGGAREELDALLDGNSGSPPRVETEAKEQSEPQLAPAGPDPSPSKESLKQALRDALEVEAPARPGESAKETTASEPAPTPAGRGPDWLDEFKSKLPYLSKLVASRTDLEAQARRLLGEAAEVQVRIDALSAWDALLCGSTEEIATALSKFFPQILRARGTEPIAGSDPPALKARTEENQFLVHVVAAESSVPESAGRALLRALADDDADSKGILVARGPKGAPPPKNPADHFDPALIKLAQKRGILLLPVEALYRIGLAAAQEEGWQAEPLVEALAEQAGVFNQF